MKKQTKGCGGFRKKLATACRRMTRCAIPAPLKGYGHQGPGGTISQEEPLKDRHSKRENQSAKEVAME
jgi:hypothetical protein